MRLSWLSTDFLGMRPVIGSSEKLGPSSPSPGAVELMSGDGLCCHETNKPRKKKKKGKDSSQLLQPGN